LYWGGGGVVRARGGGGGAGAPRGGGGGPPPPPHHTLTAQRPCPESRVLVCECRVLATYIAAAQPARGEALDACDMTAVAANALVVRAVDALARPALGGVLGTHRRIVDCASGIAVFQAVALCTHRARQRALERHGLTAFPQDGLAQRTVIDEASGPVIVYPALRDEGDTVALVLTDSAEAQRQESIRGLARLVLLRERQTARHLAAELRKQRQLTLHYAPLGTWEQLRDSLLRASVRHCFFADGELPCTAAEFADRISGRRGDWLDVFWRLLDVAGRTVAKRFECVRELEQATSPAFRGAVDDMRQQVQRLVPPDFLERFSLAPLHEVPRYLDGVVYRLAHLQGRVDKDAQAQRIVHGFESRLEAASSKTAREADVEAACFAIEELRIALFAQPLGTRDKISPQRLERLLRPLEERAGLR
jgi:hypothetical protein